ncbi:uncharacterized protein LOC132058602 [Lycium ferocissimum]|uniref:uncharacterized protein LOC132058602 n=1 Tax=Lycium ferocissimum TaxID=112874 RepID=UPI002814AE45|nr:uncharacterized protein LOC132058602 [Lycium ferocissimum]
MQLLAVQRLRIFGLEHMPYPGLAGLAGLAAEMIWISEDAAAGGGPGAPRERGRAGRGHRAAGGSRARRGRGAAARGPGGEGHHLIDEADEADPIPEGVHGLVHPQPFQAGGSSPGDSPTFTPALLLAEIPGSSSQPSQNAYMEERDNVDWVALRASLADERPVRNLEGARILDFNEFLIPDSAPVGPQDRPIQEHSHRLRRNVHPSAPEVATPDEEEVEFPDLAQPEVLACQRD